MKIAQVPPLYESVPPKMYGGTERIVSYITEELVRQGHDVTLFGTADSVTNSTLYEVCHEALRLNKECKDPLAWHIYQMQLVMEHAHEFDIIHFHNDYLHFPFSHNSGYKHITTLHGRLDLPDLQPLYKKFNDIPVVSISNHQRSPIPYANWAKTIYHGIPADLYQQGTGEGGYLAFLGRISPEKRPDRAIEIAKRTGMKLKIAAKVDKADAEYYKNVIEPMIDDSFVEFIGEIGEDQKGEFLGNAKALLFPIDWPEPFGMVMIEAMANGTPVIAFNCGSVPEVIDEGKTGFIVNSIEEAIEKVNTLDTFDRVQCRRVFDEKYTAE
ncbi:MAG: glycosyltransferase family 4 protein [Sphingobacteriales bacterium]|nr:MAG: glycosyltransferase family 4 protein [Sphingobacteriales bacterium]